jgi:hypothetical protein
MGTFFKEVIGRYGERVDYRCDVLDACVGWNCLIPQLTSPQRKQEVILLMRLVLGDFDDIINHQFGRVI